MESANYIKLQMFTEQRSTAYGGRFWCWWFWVTFRAVWQVGIMVSL